MKPSNASYLKGLLLLLTVCSQTSHADDAPTFNIHHYTVTGNSLLPAAQVDSLLTPFTGQNKNFGDVQKALEALQTAYQAKGYGAVQVLLPEQELKQGDITLTVVEQTISSVTIEGNQFHDEANIRNSLPSLRVGMLPNMKALASNLKVANENPSKQTSILFNENESDNRKLNAVIKVNDVAPRKGFVTLDNAGSRQTGQSRLGVGYQQYNLFNRDDRLSLQFVTTLQFPEEMAKMDKVKIFGVGYSMPLYNLGDSVDFFAGYSDVNAGTLLGGALNVTSKGLVWGARYNLNLQKIQDYQHKVVFGVDYKAFRPNTDASGANLTPAATVTPISISYQGNWTKQNWQFGYSLGMSANIPTTDHGHATQLSDSPWFSEVHYQKYTVGADFTKSLVRDWQLHAAFSGQYTQDHLHPGEQFGLGGMDSVRGWHERVFAGDKGYRMTLEAISPNFGPALFDKTTLKSVVFFDHGWINNNANVLDESSGIPLSISSVGAGLRMSAGEHFVGRLDYALVVEGDKTSDPAATHSQSRSAGDKYGHISLAWLW